MRSAAHEAACIDIPLSAWLAASFCCDRCASKPLKPGGALQLVLIHQPDWQQLLPTPILSTGTALY